MPFRWYEAGPVTNQTIVGGITVKTNEVISNGRVSYIIFEILTALFLDFKGYSQRDSDLIDLRDPENPLKVEVKAFRDRQFDDTKAKGNRFIHTAPSSTFANNSGSAPIKKLLREGKYEWALNSLWDTGFGKNSSYVYSNTRAFSAGTQPFRFMLVPTSFVMSHLDPVDPRLISRDALYAAATGVEYLT